MFPLLQKLYRYFLSSYRRDETLLCDAFYTCPAKYKLSIIRLKTSIEFIYTVADKFQVDKKINHLLYHQLLFILIKNILNNSFDKPLLYISCKWFIKVRCIIASEALFRLFVWFLFLLLIYVKDKYSHTNTYWI